MKKAVKARNSRNKKLRLRDKAGVFVRAVFLLTAAVFIAVVLSQAYFADSKTISGNVFTLSDQALAPSVAPSIEPSVDPSVSPSIEPSPTTLTVKINEVLANAVGADNAPMPDGEWVELFNGTLSAVDVDGWYLFDTYDSHELIISSANVGGGSTNIAPGGYLVVYRDGDGDFELNNTSADSVRLYNGNIGSGTLQDSFNYGSTTEGKTWARVPDGSATWLPDRDPTKGVANGI